MANFFDTIIKWCGLGAEAATTVDPDDYSSVSPEQYAEHYKATGALGCIVSPPAEKAPEIIATPIVTEPHLTNDFHHPELSSQLPGSINDVHDVPGAIKK